MPSITVSNGPSGPTLNILIGPSVQLQQALKDAGITAPSPVACVFLVDTGASHTVVDADVIAPLGLNPTGAIMIHTPSTAGNAVSMPQFDLMIYVPGATGAPGWLIDSLPVTASSFKGQPIDGLIGRDIIDRGLLVYNGTSGHFTLAY